MGYVSKLRDLDLTTECYSCGKEITRKDVIFINENPFCEECKENLARCERCNNLFQRENMSTYENHIYCNSCWERVFRQNVVKSYNWMPDEFKEHGDDVKLGSELEIEAPNGEDKAKYAVKIYKWMEERDLENLFYFKHDGSLRNGFEIVSMPLALSIWKDLPLEEMFDYITHIGGRSHDTNTCGLHVHLERNYISNNNTLAKCYYFLSQYKSKIIKFTRRSKDKLHQYSAINIWTKDDIKKNRTVASGEKYRSINTNHRFSYEFRIYRGTLNYESYMSCLEFTKLLVDYVREKSVESLGWTAFTNYTNEESDYLYKYLSNNNLI